MRFHSPLPNAAKLLGEGNKEEERGCHQKKGSRQSKHSQVRKMSAKLWSFQACLQKNPHPNQSQDPCIHITTFQIISRQLTTPQRAETVQLYFQGERNVYGIEGISEAEVPVLISSKPHNNQLIITSNCKLLLPKNCWSLKSLATRTSRAQKKKRRRRKQQQINKQQKKLQQQVRKKAPTVPLHKGKARFPVAAARFPPHEWSSSQT